MNNCRIVPTGCQGSLARGICVKGFVLMVLFSKSYEALELYPLNHSSTLICSKTGKSGGTPCK